MNSPPQMPPARRRPIAGMPAVTPEPIAGEPDRTETAVPISSEVRPRADGSTSVWPAAAADGAVVGRRSDDYGATRLVNFRLPVDLHDRCKALVREVEALYPRLRHPSVTELVIALLEEGPTDAAAAAELIRRERAAEHGVEL
jgi:hypothetical protein